MVRLFGLSKQKEFQPKYYKIKNKKPSRKLEGFLFLLDIYKQKIYIMNMNNLLNNVWQGGHCGGNTLGALL